MGRVTRCAVITGVLIIGAIVLTSCVTAPAVRAAPVGDCDGR